MLNHKILCMILTIYIFYESISLFKLSIALVKLGEPHPRVAAGIKKMQ
jgi:hypothetical protein